MKFWFLNCGYVYQDDEGDDYPIERKEVLFLSEESAIEALNVIKGQYVWGYVVPCVLEKGSIVGDFDHPSAIFKKGYLGDQDECPVIYLGATLTECVKTLLECECFEASKAGEWKPLFSALGVKGPIISLF